MKTTIANDYLEISVKSKGAEICSMLHKTTNIQHIWQADPAFWAKHSPILFPVVGVVNEGTYTLGGKTYQMPKHGFARDNEFELVEQTATSLTYCFSSNEKTLKNYPFEFDLFLSYQLEGRKLIFDYKVVNKGNSTMYFSLGGHPAFAYPFLQNEQLTDYVLKFSEKETVNKLLLNVSTGLFTGKVEEKALDNEDTIALTNETFNQDALVFEGLSSKTVQICSEKNEHSLTFDFSNWKYLAFWSAPKAPYVCIEPWFGLADFKGASGDITTKTGIEKLAGNTTFSASYSVEVK